MVRVFQRSVLCSLVGILCLVSSPCAMADEFKVGMILPLSGPVAAMGEAFRKGADLFLADHPEARVELKFVYEDSQYDGKATVSAYRKLADVDKVRMNVVWGNTPSGAAAPVAESQKTPLLSISMNPDAKGRSHVVTFGPIMELSIGRIAQEFRLWNLANPAAVSIDIGNAMKGIEMLRKSLDGKLIERIVATEERDFKSIIAQLRSRKVDGILLFLMPEQAVTFARQCLELNYRPKVMGGDIFADDKFLRDFSAMLPELAFVYGAVEPEFVNRLRAELGGASYFYETASGYSVAAILHRLSKLSTSEGGAALIGKLGDLSLADLPVLGVKLLENQEYGLHFENDVRAYYAGR